MKIILTHRYLDFDALASMVAVQKIYPDAVLVIEGKYSSLVQEFLALTKEHLPFYKLKDIDIYKVQKIILVDTYELNRSIGNKHILEILKSVELEIFDHHPYSGPKGANVTIEMVGACTTILVEKIMNKGLKLSSFEATLLALGIYDDTGSLLFESTTIRDLLAVAYLLGQGAQLGVIAEYLHKPLTSEQMVLFQQLLDNGTREIFEKTPVYISYAECEEYSGGLALLAQRIGEIESADIWFIVVKMANRIYLVGRSRGIGFPVNKIMQAFGGAGHKKAASAVIKDSNLNLIIRMLKEEIIKWIEEPNLVKDIMSYPVKTVFPDTTMEEASNILLKYGHTGVPVVENNNLVGVISRRDVAKAIKHGLQHAPVKGFMTKEVVSVTPEESWEEVQKLMVLYDVGRIPVVESGQLVGIVSRSDVLPLVYGSVIPTTSELARKRSVARREDILGKLQKLPKKMQHVLGVVKDLAMTMNCIVYLVGGFVRDLLLGVPSTDLDIVIEGDSLSFAKNLREKLSSSKLTLHSSFGTARLDLIDGTHLDIAGSRREDYDFPGALPTVEKSSLKEDLFRRDFTINAMALCLNESCLGEIIDYYGGFRDLQQGEIRFLHNLSFIEDPTRILRAVRFAGRYGFKLAKITRDAIVTALEAQVFSKVSPERFTEELLLIYNEPNYQTMGKKLIEYGVFGSWFKSDFLWYYTAREDEVKQWPIEKRWLVSLKNIDNLGINKILEQLTLNKPLQKITLEYLRLREDLKPRILSLSKIDELLFGVPEILIQALAYQDEFAKALKKYTIALSEMNMKVTGNELIQLGFNEGPIIGKILRQVRNLWLEGRINTSAEEQNFIERLLYSKIEG